MEGEVGEIPRGVQGKYKGKFACAKKLLAYACGFLARDYSA